MPAFPHGRIRRSNHCPISRIVFYIFGAGNEQATDVRFRFSRAALSHVRWFFAKRLMVNRRGMSKVSSSMQQSSTYLVCTYS